MKRLTYISCVYNLIFNGQMELANNHFPVCEAILIARFIFLHLFKIHLFINAKTDLPHGRSKTHEPNDKSNYLRHGWSAC